MSPNRCASLAFLLVLALAVVIALLMPPSVSRIIIGLATDPLAGGTPAATK